eukprot:3984188-Pyramimonas_sp.AAC.1
MPRSHKSEPASLLGPPAPKPYEFTGHEEEDPGACNTSFPFRLLCSPPPCHMSLHRCALRALRQCAVQWQKLVPLAFFAAPLRRNMFVAHVRPT